MIELPSRMRHSVKIGYRGLILLTLLLIGSVAAEVDLTEFENVTTEHYVDPEHGFELHYPYTWEPRSGPSPAVDFFVTADSYLLPSCAVIVERVDADESVTDESNFELGARAKEIVKEFSQYTGSLDSATALEYERTLELSGISALELKYKAISPYGENNPLQVVVLALRSDKRIYFLVCFDTYSEDSLGAQLRQLIDSFQIREVD